MTTPRLRAPFDWDPEPDELPVSFADEPTGERGSEHGAVPIPTSDFEQSDADTPENPSSSRERPSRVSWHQKGIGSSLRRGERAMLAGLCVSAFCMGWSFGASLRSAHPAGDRAAAALHVLATAEVSDGIQREVLK